MADQIEEQDVELTEDESVEEAHDPKNAEAQSVASVDKAGNATGTAACFDRQVQFETTHQSGLYHATNGARVTLSGGFGFTKADGTRGYLGNWGVWIDGGETNFTPSSRTVAIADDDSVGNNLLQIWTLRFGQKAKLLFRH